MPRLRVVTVPRGLPVALVMAAATSAGYLGARGEWQGVWEETQARVGVAMVVALPAAAACGAWLGWSQRRDGLERLGRGSSRPAWTRVGRTWSEGLIWCLSGSALGMLPAHVLTATTSRFGQPGPLRPLAQLSIVAVTFCGGMVLGRRLPGRIGAPLVGVTVYVAVAVLSFSADRVLVALTPVDARWYTFHRVLPWTLVLQVSLWSVLSVALLLRHAGARRSSTVAAAVAGLVAAPLLYVGPDNRRPDPVAAEMVCAGVRTLVCLPRVKQHLATQIASRLEAFLVLTDGLVRPGTAFVDREASGTRAADRSLESTRRALAAAGREVRPLPDAGSVSAATVLDGTAFAYDVAATLIAEPAAVPADPATPRSFLLRWALVGSGVPIDGSARPGALDLSDRAVSFDDHSEQVNWWTGLSEPARRAWFEEHRDDVLGGGTTWDDFR